MSTSYHAFSDAYLGFAQFWPQISEGFHQTPMLGTGFIVLGIVLGLVLLFVLGYILNKKFRQGGESQDISPFTLTSREDIMQILDSAWGQGSRMELYFRIQGQHLSCLIQDLTKNSITVEPPQHLKPRQSWINRTVIVFFSIRIDRKKRLYYKFDSRIIGLPVDSSGPMIQLAVPGALKLEQKRMHLRLEPPPAYIKSLKVWPALTDSQGALAKDIMHQEQPLAEYVHSGGKPQLRLEDLSGGGMSISIWNKLITPIDEFVKKNPTLIIFLQLRDQPDPDTSYQTFYFVGRIRNYFTDQQGYYILGMQYVFCAQLDPDTGKISRWEQVDQREGVEEMTNWVVQKHLQFYREKGVKEP